MLGDLVFELMQIPGPSGFEGRVAGRLGELLREHVDDIWQDKVGNLIATKKGTEAGRSLMLLAHMDQVSMVARKVDSFVWFDRVGWISPQVLPGTPVLILGSKGDIPGIISSPTAHLPPKETEPWIDVGDRISLVSPGDPIVFHTAPRWLDGARTLLAGPSVDDRVGCAIMVEVARRLVQPPKCTIYFVATVQEETSALGARHVLRHLKPDWTIAIDTGPTTDALPDNVRTMGLREGPALTRFYLARPRDVLYPAVAYFSSARLDSRLLQAAQQLQLPLHSAINSYAFNDISVASQEDPEIETSSLAVPRRYGHSPYELVDVTDAQHCVDILCRFIALGDAWGG